MAPDAPTTMDSATGIVIGHTSHATKKANPRDPGACVAGNYELLEQIMMHLPRRELILSQRVSKSFKDVYDRSQNIKERLLMRLPPAGEVLHYTTRRIGPFGSFRASGRDSPKLFVQIFGYAERLNKNHEASWRAIPLELPTDTRCEVPLKRKNTWGQTSTEVLEQVQRKLQGKISLGDFADVLHDYVEDRLNGHIALCWS